MAIGARENNPRLSNKPTFLERPKDSSEQQEAPRHSLPPISALREIQTTSADTVRSGM